MDYESEDDPWSYPARRLVGGDASLVLVGDELQWPALPKKQGISPFIWSLKDDRSGSSASEVPEQNDEGNPSGTRSAGDSSRSQCVREKCLNSEKMIVDPDRLKDGATNSTVYISKRRKWRKVNLCDATSFKISLFPRQFIISDHVCELEAMCYSEMDDELSYFEKLCSEVSDRLDVRVKSSAKSKRLRQTRKHKKRKASRQVKDKYCKSLRNNNRKKLFIKHVVYKKICLESRGFNFLPDPKRRAAEEEAARRKVATTAPPAAPHKTQRYEVNLKNMSSDLKRRLDQDTLNSLVDLQHRDLSDKDLCLLLSLEGAVMQDTFIETMSPQQIAELARAERALLSPSEAPPVPNSSGIDNTLLQLLTRDITPEDYDLLLSLDESVAPRTVTPDVVKAMRTLIVTSDTTDPCPICMELYEIGNVMKFLPCDHAFHEHCVDTWLTERSLNCPVDGLPVTCTV